MVEAAAKASQVSKDMAAKASMRADQSDASH